MIEALAVLIIVTSALLLHFLIRWLLRALSITPADPCARSEGIGDVKSWLKRRRTQRGD